MKIIFKNITYLSLILIALSSCQSLKDNLEGNKKSKSAKEQLREYVESLPKVFFIYNFLVYPVFLEKKNTKIDFSIFFYIFEYIGTDSKVENCILECMILIEILFANCKISIFCFS